MTSPDYHGYNLPYGTPQQPYLPPAPPKQKKGLGVGAAVALALATSLVGGAAAGYTAGVLAGSGNRQQPSIGASNEQNALEAPVISRKEPAPEGSVEQVAAAVLPLSLIHI